MTASTICMCTGVLCLVIVTGTGTDSTRSRLPGYGGVIPLPLSTEELTLPSRSEGVAQHRFGSRMEHGRVLYANERAADSTTKPRTVRGRHPCPQSLVEARATASSPTT